MLSFQVFDYYRGGSETESTVHDNRAAFSRYRLMPRLMVDVSNIDTTCTLLGIMPPSTSWHACHWATAQHTLVIMEPS